ncbi:hypothetical protein BCL67_1514, partial [Nesterenkonia sandarakina]
MPLLAVEMFGKGSACGQFSPRQGVFALRGVTAGLLRVRGSIP